VNGGYEAAKKLLSTNREPSNASRRRCSSGEVIDANEVKLLMEGKPLPEKLPPPPPPTQAAPSTDPKVVRRSCARLPASPAEKTRPKRNACPPRRGLRSGDYRY